MPKLQNISKNVVPYKIILGNCLDVLKKRKDNSIHCVITSPPYFGLRSYAPNLVQIRKNLSKSEKIKLIKKLQEQNIFPIDHIK